MEEKETRDPVQNEATNGLKNVKGTVAMGRLPEPHSATSQFYINVEDNPDLDHTGESDEDFGYCVFGEVADGMDVALKISKAKTRSYQGYDGRARGPDLHYHRPPFRVGRAARRQKKAGSIGPRLFYYRDDTAILRGARIRPSVRFINSLTVTILSTR